MKSTKFRFLAQGPLRILKHCVISVNNPSYVFRRRRAVSEHRVIKLWVGWMLARTIFYGRCVQAHTLPVKRIIRAADAVAQQV
jgi:hypothetical protein